MITAVDQSAPVQQSAEVGGHQNLTLVGTQGVHPFIQGMGMARRASMVRLPATSALFNKMSLSYKARTAWAVMACVPLIRASPSLASRATEARPARSRALAPGSS